MALVGADIDQLHKLGDDLRSKQVDIDHIISTVRSALASTAWQGPARERLEGDWHSSFEPALGRHEGGLRLRRRPSARAGRPACSPR